MRLSGKSRFLLAAVAAMTFIAAGAVERGEKTLGLRAGFNGRNSSGLAGVMFQYAFSSRFRLAPNVDYVFRHKSTDAYSVSVNAHFPINFGSYKRFDIYPLAGVNFISWNHRLNDTDGHDTSSRTSHMGLNIGGGMEFYCTPSLKICAEGKFNWVTNYNSGVVNLGIGYVF